MASKAAIATAKRNILWFRNDLRLHDNPLLHAAAAATGESLCVYCFDPRHYKSTDFSKHKTGIFRSKFLLDSVENLRKNLKEKLDCDLLVAFDKPENVIPKLLTDAASGSKIFVQGEVTDEEVRVESKVECALPSSVVLERVINGASLYHPEDVPFRPDCLDVPDVFTPFKEKVERNAPIRSMLATPRRGQLQSCSKTEAITACINDRCSMEYLPSLQDLGFSSDDIVEFEQYAAEYGPKSVMPFVGGEDAALKRVQDWMFEGDNLKEYFNIRNGMLGEAYSSKLSPWLAAGCISPRMVYREVKRYESERRISNKSTYWLIFELIWRDFFRYFCKKHGNRIFFPGGAKSIAKDWSLDEEKIRRWKTGTTGQPLVDANMRELLYTGWMSNRGRQNVASYLVLDLGVDWRVGADHFESLLLDHDVCSNYGNWNSAAGLTGGRVNKFNCVKQSNDYDQHGHYIRHWVPELQHVPAPQLFQPAKLSAAEQERYKVIIGSDYPIEMPTKSFAPRPTRPDGGGQYRGKGGSGGSGGGSGVGAARGEDKRQRNSRGKGGKRSYDRVQHY